ncbi:MULTISPECIES: cytochrome P450 [unclassified Rhodococcus (in: high G+C Gram-positive bacteria)]|jgi:cytochrome P450|uniref:cytochrome P450 n=1 Tax=unclassified Rhodococcus (in: high G+C Gram-positive bacteria) TaxID=192944 RepID=UPI0002E9F5DA|nr:cytochrome P450 [Rhodococcus sp. DK17]
MNEPALGVTDVGDPAPDAATEAVNFSPLDPELADDFWPRNNDLRERCPVAWSTAHWSADESGFWVLNKHQDVMAAATNWSVYSSADGASPVQFDLDIMRMVPLETDPPLHRGVRKALNKFFTPEALTQTEPSIRATVDELIARCVEKSPADFVAEFTSQLPPIVFFETFLDKKASEIGWIMELIDMLLTQPDRVMEAAPQLLMFLSELLESRRAEGRTDDLAGTIAHMGTGEVDDGLDLDERARVETMNLMVLGGMETTMGALAGIARTLGTDNELRVSLRDADSKTLDRHVEEFLRYDSPVPTAGRTLAQDAEASGCPMKAGDRILLNWAAANRDPEKFPEPDTLNFERANANAHLAFGAGVHRCLGNHLARREIRAAVQAISELSVFELEPGYEVKYRPAFARGPISLPTKVAY